MDLINLHDYEEDARKKLSRMTYDYYAGGAHDETTLRDNRKAYERIKLRYRVLSDVSQRNLATAILGQFISMPVLVAPTACHGMADPEAEKATVRAAGAAGTVMVLSTLSNTSMEDVVAQASGPVWFQLYVYKDREVTKSLVERAENAGCSAIVLTVDAQVWGRRERDVRNQFQMPEELSLENMTPAGMGDFPKEAKGSGLADYVNTLFDPSMTWKDVEWLSSITKLPILIKGVVHEEDARRAADHGVTGVIVSNHGGRQLDTSPATIDVLPDIVDAVGGQMEILIDGGIRRGTDVLKAIALGASAVLVGRPILWGLAVDGEQGVRNVLEILRQELDLAMALCGCTSVERIGKDLVNRLTRLP